MVWKIAELFEISVQKLIEDDLSDLSGNIGMLVDFMDKLKEQTECVEIEWDNLGGVKVKLMKGLIRWAYSLLPRMVAFVMQHLEEIVKWYFFGR